MTATMTRAPAIDAAEITVRIREILNRHPAVGLAVGVVHDGALESFHGHGVADIASKGPITEETIFRIASITKTFTAIAVMQLWEQGLVDLDAPANDYLRAYKLVPTRAGWRPATIRHLLTHTAGLPETVHPWDVFLPDWGESVKVGQPRPPLLLPDGFEKRALEPMKAALRGYGSFEVRIQGLNVFRDVLVGIAYDGGHSAEIRRRLARVLPELPDKYWNTLPAVPHITLAQFAGTAGLTQLRDAVTSLRDVYLGTLRVTRLYLVRSPLLDGVFGEPKRRAIPLTG